jgi:ssDNA-binding Zn-finger/Zn-ribbon topoisomerase 1
VKTKAFFCESCSALVPPFAERCPRCGKFFDSVKCPKCLFSGSVKDFLNGCPACSYLSAPAAEGKKHSKRDLSHRTFFLITALLCGAMLFILYFYFKLF